VFEVVVVKQPLVLILLVEQTQVVVEVLDITLMVPLVVKESL
jgi:hypothetical protein